MLLAALRVEGEDRRRSATIVWQPKYSMNSQIKRRRLLQGLVGAGVFAALGASAKAWARGSSPSPAPTGWNPYTFALPEDGSRLVGRLYRVSVQDEENVLDLARKFDVGYWDVALANPDVDLQLPRKGERILIPGRHILPDAPQEGIVVNIAEMRLYFYPPAQPGRPRYVITHPVGVGRQDWSTPLGRTEITEMIPDPAWYPPASIRAEHAAEGRELAAVVPPGPDNPLGRHALILDIPGYLLHGTNKPGGVGMQVSHGCVRLYPEDIARLFPRVRRGMPVRLVNQPIKLAWSNAQLYAQLRPLPHPDEYRRLRREAHLPVLSAFRHRVAQAALAAGFAVPDSFVPERALARGFPLRVPLI